MSGPGGYDGGMPTLVRTPPLASRPGGHAVSGSTKRLAAFLDASPAVALVEVTEAKGSTPREKGAWMLVSADAIYGTIGGGQLEYMAIDKAWQMLGGFVKARDADAAPHPATATFSPRAGRRGTAARISPIRGVAGETGRGGQPSSPRLQGEDAGRQVRGKAGISNDSITLDVPLGPEIGQCCGGRVGLGIRLIGQAERAALLARAAREDAARSHVFLFGGGHVGHALASALVLLPLNVTVVETRADALDGLPEEAGALLTPVPEEAVREAPPGAAFLVLTHDHALDFLIVAEALRRDDAAYVGMIGSKTKKATFRSWFLKEAGGSEDAFSRLVCPIGGADVKDKRPAVIAALAAAEVMRALLAG